MTRRWIKTLLPLWIFLLTAMIVPLPAFAGPEFKAAKYPATVHGVGKVGLFKVFKTGNDVECLGSFHGQLKEASSTLRLAVTFAECKGVGLPATANAEGCEYVVHATEFVSADEYKAHLGLECPAGKSIKVRFLDCTVSFAPQTGLTTVFLKDDTSATPVEDITVDPEVGGVTYTVTRDGPYCPVAEGKRADAEIISEGITLTGQNPTNASEKIAIQVFKGAAHEEETHTSATDLREKVEHAEHTLSTINPEPPEFTAAKYPATVHGSSASGNLVITTQGGTVECSDAFHGELGKASSTIDLGVTGTECEAFGFLSATMTAESCAYRLHATAITAVDQYAAHMGVKCPIGKSIKVHASTCGIEIKEQTGLTGVELKDNTAASPVEDISLGLEVSSLAYTVTKDGFLCPFGGVGPKTDGKVQSSESITLTAQSPGNPAEKIGFKVS